LNKRTYKWKTDVEIETIEQRYKQEENTGTDKTIEQRYTQEENTCTDKNN
jgi:hypothetical protein